MKIKGTKIENDIMNLFSQYRNENDISDLEIALCEVIENRADIRNKQLIGGGL